MKPTHTPHAAQRGIALIEALVAMVVLALGLLGLAAVQARMLSDTGATNARATAIRMIGDLSERVRLNAQGAQPVGAAQLSPYSDAAAPTIASAFPIVGATAPGGCNPAVMPTCTPQDQAAYDLWVWRSQLAQSLMGGKASVWQINTRQLQVIVAWNTSENTNTALGSAASGIASQLQVIGASGTSVCGTGQTLCHIDFIDIPPAQ